MYNAVTFSVLSGVHGILNVTQHVTKSADDSLIIYSSFSCQNNYEMHRYLLHKSKFVQKGSGFQIIWVGLLHTSQK